MPSELRYGAAALRAGPRGGGGGAALQQRMPALRGARCGRRSGRPPGACAPSPAGSRELCTAPLRRQAMVFANTSRWLARCARRGADWAPRLWRLVCSGGVEEAEDRSPLAPQVRAAAGSVAGARAAASQGGYNGCRPFRAETGGCLWWVSPGLHLGIQEHNLGRRLQASGCHLHRPVLPPRRLPRNQLHCSGPAASPREAYSACAGRRFQLTRLHSLDGCLCSYTTN
jgi:hypothetical protein